MRKATKRTAPKTRRTPPSTTSSPTRGVAVPAVAETIFSKALDAHRRGDLVQAETGYRETLRIEPRHPHANNNLAILLRAGRRAEEAVEYYRASLRIASDPGVHSNIACALIDLDRVGEAGEHLRRALALRPDFAEAWFNLGNIERERGDRGAARRRYERALAARPGMAEAHAGIGELLKAEGELGRAIDHFVLALKGRADMIEPCNNLGEALKEQGRVEEAIKVFQEGLRVRPNSALMHSNLLFALHYTPAAAPDVIHRAHLRWDEIHARPLTPTNKRFDRDRSPDRRLRIGYVSPDFCAHSCSYFSEPLIRAHDRSQVEIFCYMTSRRVDVVTKRFEASADHWRMAADLDDAQLAAMIERDRVDILVDMAGHTGGSRLLAFARRPAPVQATWLGYPDTTGLAAMDFRITDAVSDPEGADARNAERLVRLPRGFLSFNPAADPGPCAPSPMRAAGHVTFGSFNNVSKVSPEVIRVWSALLRRVSGSRLILKSKALGDPPTRNRFARMFEDSGVENGRVDFLARIEPVENHLRAYDRVDVALDPFPYNGTTTTCEALWMGVPVVTLLGTHHVARVGASLLAHGGLSELIARDEAGYIALAEGLARDPNRLDTLRAGLRERVLRSPLGDHAGFARVMETAFRAMWRDWLARIR